jgi:hypothetical protein
MVRAWHGRGKGMGMASVNQTRPHCVNQIGKTHSKPLAVRHGRGTVWARHDMCESAFWWRISSPETGEIWLGYVRINSVIESGSDFKSDFVCIDQTYRTRMRVLFYSSQGHRWRYSSWRLFCCRHSTFGVFSTTVLRSLRQHVRSRTFKPIRAELLISPSSEAPMSLKVWINWRHLSFLYFIQRLLCYRINVDFVH